jgi:hypothetical protein
VEFELPYEPVELAELEYPPVAEDVEEDDVDG